MQKKKFFILYLVVVLFLVYGFITAITINKINKWRVSQSTELLTQSQNTEDERQKILLLQEASMLNPNETNYLATGIALARAGNENTASGYFKKVRTAEGYYQLGRAYFDLGNNKKAKEALNKSVSMDQLDKTILLLAKVELKDNNPGAAKDLISDIKVPNQESKQYKEVIAITLGDEYIAKDLSDLDSEDFPTVVNKVYSFLRSNNYPQLAFDLLQKKAQSNSLNRDGYLYLADEYSQNNQAELSYQNLLKAKELDPYFPQTYKQLIEAAERLGKREEAERYQKFLDSITW